MKNTSVILHSGEKPLRCFKLTSQQSEGMVSSGNICKYLLKNLLIDSLRTVIGEKYAVVKCFIYIVQIYFHLQFCSKIFVQNFQNLFLHSIQFARQTFYLSAIIS